ncbi:MAG: ATP-binding protein [Thermomicrobiales bacterium]
MEVLPRPPTLYILCGLPFSGKSSLGEAIAAHTGSVVVSFDALYDAHGEELGRRLDTLAVWRAIRELAGERIGALLGRGVSVVYDNTNFRVAHREAIRAVAEGVGARAVLIHVDTPLEVIAARRAANARTRERGDISDAALAYVRGVWQRPGESEGALVYRPEMELAGWLGRLVGDTRDESPGLIA